MNNMDSTLQKLASQKLTLNGLNHVDVENAFRLAVSQHLIIDALYFITELGLCTYLWNYNIVEFLKSIHDSIYLNEISKYTWHQNQHMLYTLLQLLFRHCFDNFNLIVSNREFDGISEQIFSVVINHSIIAPRNTSDIKYKWIYDSNSQYYRILTDKTPRLDYSKIAKTNLLNCHWPIRKLVFTYLELFTELSKIENLQNVVVIYIHPSNGAHIPLVAKYFRCSKWIIVKEKQLDSYLVKNTSKLNCEIVNQLNFSSINREHKILLVSDNKFKINIRDELQEQEELVDKIKPDYMFLRFKLPYSTEIVKTVKHFKGKIYPCIWGSPFSTESTLFVRTTQSQDYDLSQYEDQMHYYNQITRKTKFENPLKNYIPGYDDSYECTVEYNIIKNLPGVKNPIVAANSINEIIQHVSKRTILGCIPHTIHEYHSRDKFKLYTETFLWYFDYTKTLNAQKNIILNKILKIKESGNTPKIRPNFKAAYNEIRYLEENGRV